MRNDNPGDLSVRIGFSRPYGAGGDANRVRPAIEIIDGTSNKRIEIELTPQQLTDMLSGSEARVPADKVTGFKGLKDWGKYHKFMIEVVPFETGDHAHKGSPGMLPHVQKVVSRIEAAGYRVDTPRRNRDGWQVIGRRYDDQP